MKSARERAEDCLKQLNFPATPGRVKRIENLLKEQDKITRHACAYEVTRCKHIQEEKMGNCAICPSEAHDACMNVKAV